jgi:large subunit ribosomal protein L10
MSKPVKGMIINEYRKRFGDLEGALVIEIRGLSGKETTSLRENLRKKNVRVTVVKNALAKRALAGTALDALSPALAGPAAIAYGTGSVVDVAREVVSWARKLEKLMLRGAVLDGQFFEGDEGVKRLSKFPTKEEAQARVVQLVLSPGSKVVGAAKGPGGRILGIVKEIQTRLEKGEAIAKVG